MVLLKGTSTLAGEKRELTLLGYSALGGVGASGV